MAKYVELLFRFKVRFFVLLFLLPAMTGTAVVVFFPSYRATSDLWVDYPSYLGTRFTPIGWNQYLTPAQNEGDILSQLLMTDSFITTLGDRLVAAGTVKDGAERRQVVASVAMNLKVTPSGSHLLQLTMTCDRREICTQVLSESIQLYREQSAQLQQDQVDVGIAFLSQQLKEAQASSKTADDALQTYLGQHPGLNPTPAAAAADPQLARLIVEADTRRNNVTTIETNLNEALGVQEWSKRLLETGPKVIDSPHISKGGLVGDGSSLKRAGLGGLVWVVVGLGYLFVLAWLDKSARDPKELENRLKVLVVATIPALPGRGN
jgi:hypothetical protein